jgi:hypothetical protein
MATFTRPFNDMYFTLTAPYTPGSGVLAIDGFATFDALLVALGLASGSLPTTQQPLRLSIDRRRDGAKSIVTTTGRSGSTFTGVAVAEGKTDIPFDAGDIAKFRMSAGYITDLQAAVQALQQGGGASVLAFTAQNVGFPTLAAGAPVAINGNGIGVVRADATTNLLPAVGLAQASTAPAATATVITSGLVLLSDWTAVTGTQTLAPRGVYYLGTTAGTLTTTPPSGTGQVVQQVGIAATPGTLDVSIAPPILL